MASGFQGFLKGFGQGGAEIIKEQDKMDRLREQFVWEQVTQAKIKKKMDADEQQALVDADKAAISGPRAAPADDTPMPPSAAQAPSSAPAMQPVNPQAGSTPPAPASVSPTGAEGVNYLYQDDTVAKGTSFNSNMQDSNIGADGRPLPPLPQQSAPNPSAITASSVTAEDRAAALAELRAKGNRQAFSYDQLNALAVEKKTKQAQEGLKAADDHSAALLRKDEFELKKKDAALKEQKDKQEILDKDPFVMAQKEDTKEVVKTALAGERDFETRLRNFDKLEQANKDKFSAYGLNLTGASNILESDEARQALDFVRQTKGSISDKEMKLFGKGSISASNRERTNQNLINAGRAVALREFQQAKFLRAWQNQYGKMDGALEAWQSYAENNAIIGLNKDKDVVLLKDIGDLAKDKSYLNYLDPNYVQENVDGGGVTAPKAELSEKSKKLMEQFPSLQSN